VPRDKPYGRQSRPTALIDTNTKYNGIGDDEHLRTPESDSGSMSDNAATSHELAFEPAWQSVLRDTRDRRPSSRSDDNTQAAGVTHEAEATPGRSVSFVVVIHKLLAVEP
jgi:hypothetical protein